MRGIFGAKRCVREESEGADCAGPPCANYCQDGLETDTDCGGAECPGMCGLGKKCDFDTDCVAGLKCAGLCAPM
jgi:hypothetical protein